jgi:hypothetical protein
VETKQAGVMVVPAATDLENSFSTLSSALTSRFLGATDSLALSLSGVYLLGYKLSFKPYMKLIEISLAVLVEGPITWVGFLRQYQHLALSLLSFPWYLS